MTVRLVYNPPTYLEVAPFDLQITEKSRAKVIPIRNNENMIIAMGREGPIVTMKFYLNSTAHYQQFQAMRAWTISTIVSAPSITIDYGAGAYDYLELPTLSNWIVENTESKRRGGWVDRWECTLVLMRAWPGRTV